MFEFVRCAIKFENSAPLRRSVIVVLLELRGDLRCYFKGKKPNDVIAWSKATKQSLIANNGDCFAALAMTTLPLRSCEKRCNFQRGAL